MTVIPIVIAALGTVTKEFVQGLEDLETRGRVEDNLTIVLLRSARIPRRVLETWGHLLSHRLLWKPSINTGEKNSQKSKIIITIPAKSMMIIRMLAKSIIIVSTPTRTYRESPAGVMAKILDFGTKGSEFEPQLGYYVHFRTNTLWKAWIPLSLLQM